MHFSFSEETKTDKDRRSLKWFIYFSGAPAAAADDDDAYCTLDLTYFLINLCCNICWNTLYKDPCYVILFNFVYYSASDVVFSSPHLPFVTKSLYLLLTVKLCFYLLTRHLKLSLLVQSLCHI